MSITNRHLRGLAMIAAVGLPIPTSWEPPRWIPLQYQPKPQPRTPWQTDAEKIAKAKAKRERRNK